MQLLGLELRERESSPNSQEEEEEDKEIYFKKENDIREEIGN